jgi:hypothetical protein
MKSEKSRHQGHEEKELGKAATKSFQSVLLQIIMIDLVSHLTVFLPLG